MVTKKRKRDDDDERKRDDDDDTGFDQQAKRRKTSLEVRVLALLKDVHGLSPTRPEWKGKDVDATWMDFRTTKAQRAEVNADRAARCHTCLTDVATDRDQPWIGDHQPPTELSAAARQALGLAALGYGGAVRLFPQCDHCSRTQASLVKRVNRCVAAGTPVVLSASEHNLLRTAQAAPSHGQGIDASSASVSPAQGYLIQGLGTQHGCHSCDARCPKDNYHADHSPPVAYTYSHVISLIRWARTNIRGHDQYKRIPASFVLRPQCPRCSHEQGGKMAAIAARAKELAIEAGFAVYV